MTHKERYPEFIQETMFEEQGTKVLITDPAADQYLERAKKIKEDKLKEQYPQWDQE